MMIAAAMHKATLTGMRMATIVTTPGLDPPVDAEEGEAQRA